MRILVTGASGCIGHYVAEALIQETDHELYLLVRNPDKLKLDTQSRRGINVLQGNMLEIERFADLLSKIDTAVLVAADWGTKDVFNINVSQTIKLLNLLDPAKCQQVIYFSTASVLDTKHKLLGKSAPSNGGRKSYGGFPRFEKSTTARGPRYSGFPLLKEAGEIGTDYIRSKYECIQQLSKLAIAPQTTILFPTLVLGGDAHKPYSHLSAGLPEFVKWINLIRFLRADGSFHFIHGRDVAQVVRYLIDHPPKDNESRQFVLGQEHLTVNQAIEEMCAYLNKKVYFGIPLSLSLANLLIVLFKIQMADWDRFYLRYRHFTYENVVNPASLKLPNYCATLSDVLKLSGIPPGDKTVGS